jgi:hypothetical protein
MPFAIPTTFWKAGYIYASETELLRRPGRERYDGAFRGRGAPVLESGDETVVLLTLE